MAQGDIRGFVTGSQLQCRPLELLTHSPDERQAAMLASGLRDVAKMYPQGGARAAPCR